MDLQDQQGLSYMFITHDLSVVKHISSHIAVMYLGQCVEYAETEELFAHPAHPYTQALLAAIPVIDITRRGKRWETLQGEVTSPVNPAPGCRFAPPANMPVRAAMRAIWSCGRSRRATGSPAPMRSKY